MMVGRLLVAVIAVLALLVAPPAATTQPPTKIPRIGILTLSAPEQPEGRMTVDVFRQALGELGYVEGQNIVIEYRWADGKIERLPAIAAELVGLKVDLIVAGATPQARAAKQPTATIPIVAWSMQAPIQDGLVASLARPGGNLTGLTFPGPELVPKLLALLKEALPRVTRVAALWHPGGYAERTRQEMAKNTEEAARRLGVNLQFVGADGPTDLDGAFSAMARGRAEALIVFPSPMLYG